MAQQSFNIPFQTGQYMFWTWTTQAAFQAFLTLKDSKTTYVNNQSRSSTNPLPPFNGASLINGTGLNLTVNIPQSSFLKPSISSNNILDPNGNIIGEVWTLAVEDSNDNDYNDVWVSLVAWNQKG